MAITKTSSIWYGETQTDLAQYLREYQADGYPISRAEESICQQCSHRAFHVEVDDEEGCARRTCVNCRAEAFIADSAHYWDEADPGDCECPCGGDTFAITVGFSFRDDGDVHWISVGLRCVSDGAMGVYAEWKIDYSPTDHLLALT